MNMVLLIVGTSIVTWSFTMLAVYFAITGAARKFVKENS